MVAMGDDAAVDEGAKGVGTVAATVLAAVAAASAAGATGVEASIIDEAAGSVAKNFGSVSSALPQ